jgi:hypothetical protein
VYVIRMGCGATVTSCVHSIFYFLETLKVNFESGIHILLSYVGLESTMTLNT